jgi:hypothetical protein
MAKSFDSVLGLWKSFYPKRASAIRSKKNRIRKKYQLYLDTCEALKVSEDAVIFVRKEAEG